MKKLVLLCVLVSMVSMVNATIILNGDFETLDPGAPVFTSWTDIGAATATVPISGTYSAKMVKTGGGNIQQNLSTPLPVFEIDFDLALSDPGSGSNDRSFAVNLWHTNTTSGSPYHQINLRIVRGSVAGKGTIQVYNQAQTTPGFVTVLTDAVTFSALDTALSVNHVEVSGDYGDGTPSYYIETIDAGSTTHTSLELTAWHGSAPVTTGDNLTSIKFDSSGIVANSWFVVDNVTPEPATIAILGLGSLLGMRRRRS